MAVGLVTGADLRPVTDAQTDLARVFVAVAGSWPGATLRPVIAAAA